MFVEHCVECSSTGNCKSNCSGNKSAAIQVKVRNITSDAVNIPVIDCAECLGKRECPRCPTRNGFRTSERAK